MKMKSSIRSLLVMLVMAFMFTAIVPAVLPQTHTAEAAKKKKSSKKKSKKKSATVNLKINKDMVTVKVGKSASIKVSGNAKKTVKWSTTSKCVKLSKKSGTSIKVKGVKEGCAAVVAKVGKSKVVCCVYVGKGTYADASGKTRKAIGNPIRLLASWVAKHPISIQAGNTNTSGSPKASVWNKIYGLSVSGSNLVVSVTDQTRYNSGGTETSTETMLIPITGVPVATVTSNSSEVTPGETPWSSSSTCTINMNSITPGTEISYSYAYSSGSRGTGKDKFWDFGSTRTLIDVLHCFLVDNKTGFTARDIGFSAYPASHNNIGVLTAADLQAFAAQCASARAYNQAHYNSNY